MKQHNNSRRRNIPELISVPCGNPPLSPLLSRTLQTVPACPPILAGSGQILAAGSCVYPHKGGAIETNHQYIQYNYTSHFVHCNNNITFGQIRFNRFSDFPAFSMSVAIPAIQPGTSLADKVKPFNQ